MQSAPNYRSHKKSTICASEVRTQQEVFKLTTLFLSFFFPVFSKLQLVQNMFEKVTMKLLEENTL